MNKRSCDENMNDHSQNIKRAKTLHDSIISENGTVKFDFMTSLQNIVTAKIITHLWMNRNTQQQIANLFHRYSGWCPKRQRMEDNIIANVCHKVSQLCLPNSIIPKLTHLVPIVGKSIHKWVRYHDAYIFRISKSTKYSAADLINHITWTARGKIDYAATAKSMLDSQNGALSDDHKYKIACNYCFKEEVYALAPNVVNPCYLDAVKIHEHPMLHFWTAHITGDYTKLQNPSNFNYITGYSNMSSNERLMRMLIVIFSSNSLSNEVQIRYVWNKLSEEEKAKNIANIIELRNKELGYSLLSSLDYEQQKCVFKKVDYIILTNVLNDFLWEEYFLQLAFHLLDIMEPESYMYILEEINDKKMKNCPEVNKNMYDRYKSFFKELWLKSSDTMKNFIFEYRKGGWLEQFITYSLSWEQDMDVIDLLFNDLNTQQKESIIFGENGISRCADFIKNDQWDLLEKITNKTLSSEDDISHLKDILIKVKENEIVAHFSDEETWDKMEHFMSWVFKTEEEIDYFRLNLAHVIDISDLDLYYDTLNLEVLEQINAHFKWCAKGNIEVVKKLKSEIPKLYFKNEIRKLIENDKYELLDQLLNWCFTDDNQQISHFKCNLYKDCYLSNTVRELIFNLIERNYSFKMLEKYTEWCFTNNQDVQEFKTWILYPLKDSLNICAELLENYRFQLADELLNWCGISPEEISTFKNAFMLSDDMVRILYAARWDKLEDLQSLIKWFTPSKETVPKFKKLISDKKSPRNYYEWLSELIERRILLIAYGEENSLEDLQERLDSQRLLSSASRRAECWYRW